MIRDVTEMRYLQTLADRADRMKVLGEMAAQVAHEIRNPLGGIKGFASLLKRDLISHPEMQQMAASIVEGTDNLNHLVDQILHYSRPVQAHTEATDLILLLKQVKEHIMADANIYKSNINIHIETSFSKISLPLDTGLFKSALLNLIVNAIQAMPNGGTITLALRKQLYHVILSVSDTGTGIPEDLIPKLYSPFFTTKREGNGLGLIEVQKVIHAHGGTIDVTSIVNQGTTFIIKLPIKHKNGN
jgi:signal transduction histidine kinase